MPEGRTDDLLVVGGGPAGAAAAITAAGLGLRVTLLEGCPRPRELPGETVHPGIETVLHYLGVMEAFRAAGFERYPGIVLDHAGTMQPQLLGSDAEGPWEGWQLRRSVFDELLRTRAADLGVEVRCGVRALRPLREGGRVAGAEIDGGAMRARWVLDASGHQGWLASQLSLATRRYSERLYAGFGHVVDEAEGAAPRFRPERDGWTWQAHVRAGVSAWVRLARRPEEACRAPEGAAPLARPAAREVTWRLTRPAAGEGFVIAGEAAARLDPACGQGILRALVGGVQAARTVHAALQRPSEEKWVLVDWDRWVVDTFEEQVEQLARTYAELGIELEVGTPFILNQLTA